MFISQEVIGKFSIYFTNSLALWISVGNMFLPHSQMNPIIMKE